MGYSPWGCKKLDTTDQLTLIGGAVLKNPLANAGNARDVGLIPGWGRSPGEGNGNLLKYSCLENPMDRGDWQAAVPGVARVRHDLLAKERERDGTECHDPSFLKC